MISLSTSGAVAEIALDRPGTRNALNREGWRGLAAAIAQLASTEVRVLLLRSAVPGAFCSGSDLNELAELAENESERAPFRSLMRDAIDALPALGVATIAVIDGDCFGAGVALALGCDMRIAGDRARFAVTPAKLGIAYPKEDVERLVQAVGHGQAARLLFSAETIDPAEAARIGLIELACPSAETRARLLAQQIAGNAGFSVTALKSLLAARADSRHDARFDEGFAGEDFRNRLAAFRSRRDGDADGSPETAE